MTMNKPKTATVIEILAPHLAKVPKVDTTNPGQPGAVAEDGAKSPRRSGRPRSGKAVARDAPRDEEILRIAANVLYKRGLDGPIFEDIAREAGISKGSVYHYFGSKQELYERLVNNVRGRINFEEEIRGHAPARERLQHLIRTRLEATVEYPLEVGLLSRELLRMEGPVGDWARNDPKRYLIAIRQLILQGQREGTFRPMDLDIMASTIFGILVHVTNWYRLGGRIQAQDLVYELVDFIIRGLLADPPSRRKK
jgi:TetR/AcrR family transcriptional regulator, cholesterol catabolism regulator